MPYGSEKVQSKLSMWAQRLPSASGGLPCCSAVQEHRLKALHVKWSLVRHLCRLRCVMLATLHVCRHMSGASSNLQGHLVRCEQHMRI